MSLTTPHQGVTTEVGVGPATGPTTIDLTASGTLDARATLELREAIVQHLADGPCLVLIDVTHVRHVAASGMVGALELLHLARRHGGDLRLYGASLAIRQANVEAQLSTIARSYITREQAVAGKSVRMAPTPRRRSLSARLFRRH